MKKIYIFLSLAVAGTIILASTNRHAGVREGFVNGAPEIKSISALTFGPDGILFIGDSKSATVFAVDTKDNQKVDKAEAVEVKQFDQKIAAALGTEVKNVSIQDLVVNPVSKKIYCAVQLNDGTAALLKVNGEKIESVNLKDVNFSQVALTNVPGEEDKDQRGRPIRPLAISDIGFYDGKVLVSGLSNQEFSSTFRSIPFPFTNKQDQSSLEIYHAAHKKYETYAPIRTFTASEINGKKYLIASFTCTPLVLFPLEDLKPGTHVKGRTIAEMGAGNSPLDMITMNKNGESVLLMSNSSRPIFKVKYKTIEEFQGSLTTPVEESFGTAGVHFVSLPVVNVLQLDKLDETKFVLLQRKPNGDLDLYTPGDWML
ncbi:hypothetical protein [Chryseolinea sp. H1M3-3]|uniref:hypothetical protein n=1 Tax=Chryseolinea sp. H1M3-3 TaxID=3034144 RepID=UPI0023EC3769|nr:hypothetical protein [Chryseolinea sp. H1M3-3]